MATGQFTKKVVDIEALMAQAAALEQEEKEKSIKKEKPAKVKKVKPPKIKKFKPEKKKKKSKEEAKKVFGIPLQEVEIDEDEEMPLIWVTLISVLESYGMTSKLV